MYDLVIVGGGPAGYVAAERAGESGAKTLLVERDRLGGVCLNAGCIPTKSLLYSAKLYAHTRAAAAFGVHADNVRFDYPAVKARTGKVQETLRQGIAGLLRKAKTTVANGTARLAGRDPDGAFVVDVDGEKQRGARLLLCCGSRAALPPVPGLRDNPRVVASDGILAREALPANLVVIGGGVIGLEFACFHALAGVPVTVVEMLPAIGGPGLDGEAAKTLQRRLEEQGVTFHLGARVRGVDGGRVDFIDKKGEKQSATAELVLAATGRAPACDGLGLETIGVELSPRGAIVVDESARANVAGVYAAGDCTGRIQLAHYASRQATVAVRSMFGTPDRMREEAIPSVIYADPEIAQVGLTEEQAKAAGRAVKVRKLPLGASGRYLAESNGGRAFVKAVLGDPDGAVLGMTVVGPYASEMIGAACVMREMEMRAADVSEVVFPHPTVAELMRDIMF